MDAQSVASDPNMFNKKTLTLETLPSKGFISFSKTASSVMGAGSTGSVTGPVYLSPEELRNVLEQPEFALDTSNSQVRDVTGVCDPAEPEESANYLTSIQEKCSDLKFPSGSGIYKTRSGRVGSLVADHLGIDGFNTRVMFKAQQEYAKPEMRSYKSMKKVASSDANSSDLSDESFV